MRALIVENETYLAQSISGKLGDSGHECVIVSTAEDALSRNGFDVVLLSVNTGGSSCKDVISHYINSIIILMVSYVSDDTVTKSINMGAKDYILKPFIMDELLRKIEHYNSYRELVTAVNFFENYFGFIQGELRFSGPIHHSLPILVKASSQRSADMYAMKYAIEKKVYFEFVNLSVDDWFNLKIGRGRAYYVTNFELLKKSERKSFLDFAQRGSFMISLVSDEAVSFPYMVDITDVSNTLEIGSDIVSVRDYERIVIAKFGSRYPDTELAKKLGMSRKSLWEKRKKYGISREKRRKSSVSRGK